MLNCAFSGHLFFFCKLESLILDILKLEYQVGEFVVSKWGDGIGESSGDLDRTYFTADSIAREGSLWL